MTGKILLEELISRIVISSKWLISQEYDFAFNNREIAFGIIILVSLVCMLLNKGFRKSITKLINSLFQRYLIRLYIEIFLYCSLMVTILYKIGFWNFNYTKDALVWILFSAFYLSFKVENNKDDKMLFKNILKDAVGVAVVVEFLLNVYTFSIIAEVLLIVATVLVGMMIASTEASTDKDKKGKVYKSINMYIGLIVLFLLAFEILTNFEDLLTVDTLQSFLLPIIFTIMFIPYLFYLLVWITYQKAGTPVGLNKVANRRVVFYFKMRMYMRCKLSRKKIVNLIKTKNHLIINMKTKKDVDNIFRTILL